MSADLPEWFANAACIGVDLAMFFPASDNDAGEARKVCARCPIRQGCLQWALDQREPAGVWGGHTARERRRMIRRRPRPGVRGTDLKIIHGGDQ